MKRIGILPILLLAIACDPEPELVPELPDAVDSGHTGMFILSEGLFNKNNSRIGW